MGNNRAGGHETEIFITYASASRLRGRQSVRATFKLPPATIDAVSALSTHLGIKQKSLFDHLMDDIKALESIASQAQKDEHLQPNRVQKTYVISRQALTSLEEVAKEYKTPRDALIELSVRKLLPLIRQEQEKHEKRKKVFVSISAQMEADKKLLRQTRMLLGKDDLVSEELASALLAKQQAMVKIAEFIERGKIIEQFALED